MTAPRARPVGAGGAERRPDPFTRYHPRARVRLPRLSRPARRAAAVFAPVLAIALASAAPAPAHAQNTPTVTVSASHAGTVREGQSLTLTFTASPRPTADWRVWARAYLRRPHVAMASPGRSDWIVRAARSATRAQGAPIPATLRLSIPINDDDAYLGPGTLSVRTYFDTGASSYARAGQPATAEYAIEDDDPKPVITLRMAEDAVTEGKRHIAWFSADRPLRTDVPFTFRTVPLTASAGDYQSWLGQGTISRYYGRSGQSIYTSADALDEGDERFRVELVSAEHAVIGTPSTATATIIDGPVVLPPCGPFSGLAQVTKLYARGSKNHRSPVATIAYFGRSIEFDGNRCATKYQIEVRETAPTPGGWGPFRKEVWSAEELCGGGTGCVT